MHIHHVHQLHIGFVYSTRTVLFVHLSELSKSYVWNADYVQFVFQVYLGMGIYSFGYR